MDLTDEKLKKLLQEQLEMGQTGIEPEPLTVRDKEAYAVLFQLLERERRAQNGAAPVLADGIMAAIVKLEDKKDQKRDTITLILGIALGLLAIAIIYFFVDMPSLLQAARWLSYYLPVIIFSVVALVLIQLADRKLVRKE